MSRYGLDRLAAEKRAAGQRDPPEGGPAGASPSSHRSDERHGGSRESRRGSRERSPGRRWGDDDRGPDGRERGPTPRPREGGRDRADRPAEMPPPPPRQYRRPPEPASPSTASASPLHLPSRPVVRQESRAYGRENFTTREGRRRPWQEPPTTPASTPEHSSGATHTRPGPPSTTGTSSMVLTRASSPEPSGRRERYKEWGSEQDAREWYETEEGTTAFDESGGGRKFVGEAAEHEAKEQRLKRSVHSLSARQRRMNADNAMWEERQLINSGVAQINEANMDLETVEEIRVHIIVHRCTPPFLDEGIEVAREQDLVLPVRDPTNDMARLARGGSELLKRMRQMREREKGVKEKLKLAGTTLGNIMGVKEDERDDEQKVREDAEKAAQEKDEVSAEEGRKAFEKIQNQRASLPITKCRDELMQQVRDNKVLVIVGETGSGKTTQLTQFLHQAGYTKGGRIGCTQPRRVAAMSVAKRVSEEFGCQLGDEIGYSIRFEDVTSDKTIIKYMTDGVLLRESLKEPDLDQYQCVVMDEAHERSLNTDVLFGILKKVVARRRDLKLIVTSATMDADKFSAFFGSVPIFYIRGRTFPVEVRYTKNPVTDYVDAAVKQAAAIHLGGAPGDILIFMTGQEDIECTCYCLRQRMLEVSAEMAETLHILPIYSLMPSELQAKIFERTKEGHRKCIVATNIAETSLTVDGIYYVIDSGFAKLKVYNPRIGMDALQVYPESQAAANQRKGRAGRTGPGTCFRLFTEAQFKLELLENTVPEMQRTNLGNVVLLLKSLGVGDIQTFEFMDPPPKENLQQSMLQLWMLGALDDQGDMTGLGRKMVEFPLDPPLSKMLIVSAKPAYGCGEEILTIVSMLSIPQIFLRPKERAEQADAARERFFVAESDHLSLLNVFQQWRLNGKSSNWSNIHFINHKGMKRVAEIRQQLQEIMRMGKLEVGSCGANWDPVRKCLASGFFHHSARRKGIGEYVT
eukprot:EG_transcript_2127